MKIKEITNIIEAFAPKSTACDFDNVGLLVGTDEAECTGVLIAVDVTAGAIAEAIKKDCNLIIAHHPVIFNAITALTNDDYQNVLVAEALVNGVNLYAAHTNVDMAKDNMAKRLLSALEANDVSALCENGLGAIGNVAPISLKALAKVLGSILNDNRVFTVGDDKRIISRVASVNGAGADEETVKAAMDGGADVLISSDLKHHIMLKAREEGFTLVSVGHYASEKAFIDIIFDIIKCHIDTTITKYYERNLYN